MMPTIIIKENGAQKLGWFQESGKWYYLQAPEGRMATGLQEVANEYYYFNTAGEMQTGWKWIEGYYHYFQESRENDSRWSNSGWI